MLLMRRILSDRGLVVPIGGSVTWRLGIVLFHCVQEVVN
jgi:hypothetical protein